MLIVGSIVFDWGVECGSLMWLFDWGVECECLMWLID